MLTVCLVLLTALCQASVAVAGNAGLGVGFRFPHGGYLGTYTVNEQPTFCIDLNGQGPSTAGGYLAGSGGAIRKQVGWTPDHAGGNAGAVRGPWLTATELAQLGYLTDRYAATSSATTAAAAEHLVRILTVGDTAQTDRETARWAETVAAHPATAAVYRAMQAEVTQRAGPYQLLTSWTTAPGVLAPGVLKVQVMSAAGTPMTDVPVTARYQGSVTGKPVTGSTGALGTASLTVPVTAVGTLDLKVTSGGLPSAVPTLFTPRQYGNSRSRDHAAQRMIGRAPRAGLTTGVTAEITTAVPTVTTAVVAATVPAGTPLADTVTVKGTAPVYGAPVVASLWGPFPKKPTAADCTALTTPAGQVTVTVTGDGTVTTPTITAPASGYYTWTEDLPGSAVQAAVSTPCAAAGETTLVQPPVTPTVSTVASAATGHVGDQLTDTVTVKGTATGYSAPMVASLWGPFPTKPTAADCTTQATPAGQVTVTVTGNGTVTTPAVTATAPGYYTWTDQLPGSPAQAAVSTPCGTSSETTLIQASATVVLSTVGSTAPGGTLHAELTAAGFFPLYAPTAAVALYGPFATAPGARDCVSAKRVTKAALPLPGNGLYPTDDVTVVTVGYYTWTFGVPGNSTQPAVAQVCGSAAGTFVVARTDLGALTVTTTSTQGSITATGTLAVAKAPQVDIPSAGIAVPLVATSLKGAGIDVPADPSLAGQLDAGANAGDPMGTIVVGGRVSDVHGDPGGLASLMSVAVGASITLIDVHGRTQRFTVDSVTVQPRTQNLAASLFTQSTPLRLVILSATDPIHYGPAGSLVTHRSNVILVASPS